MSDKPFHRRDGVEIIDAVDRFVEYHDDFHEAVQADRKANGHQEWYSVDRGTFSEPILPADALEYLGAKRDKRSFAYGEEVGEARLRKQIAQLENLKHDTSYDESNIAMMPGAWAGLEFAIEQIMIADGGRINKKDAVLAIGPTLYQMFDRPIRRFGMNVIAHDYTMQGVEHTPTKENVDDMFREQPKIIVVTNPNNPDGVFVDNETLKVLIERAAEEGIYVIVDEIQNCFSREELRYGNWIQASHVLRVDSPAKRYSMAEYRQGWIIADSDLLGKRNRGIVGNMSGTMGNAPRAGNTALLHVLRNETDVIRKGADSILAHTHAELADKERSLVDKLKTIEGIARVMRRDACINLAVQADFKGTDMELAKRLMQERTLMMPASGYGYQPEDSVLRITFSEDMDYTNKAVEALGKVLSKS